MNNITLIGNLTREPEAFTDKGFARIGVADNVWDGEKEVPVYYSVFLWGKNKEYAMNYLHKGDKVAVVGRLSIRERTTENGVKIFDLTISANDLQFITSPKGEQGEKKKKDAIVEVDATDLPF